MEAIPPSCTWTWWCSHTVTVQSGFRGLPCSIPQMLVEKQGAAMHVFPWDIGFPPEHYVPHSTVL